MKRVLITTAATMALFLIAAGTVAAQEKKIEKRIRIVTVSDGEKNVTDTTFIIADSICGGDHKMIYRVKDGEITCNVENGKKMVVICTSDDKGNFSVKQGSTPKHDYEVINITEDKSGVVYEISVNGVSVKIRAPEEKAKLAEQVLEEVKKILNTK